MDLKTIVILNAALLATGCDTNDYSSTDPITGTAVIALDSDLDGLPDSIDDDDDGDGIIDAADAFPLNPNETIDTDGDGIGNNTDADDDGDGVSDTLDALPLDPTETIDTDLDGIGNNTDIDDDNDGVNDSEDAFPLDASETLDTDSDGIGNNVDSDDDGDGVLDQDDPFPLDSTRSGEGGNSDETGIISQAHFSMLFDPALPEAIDEDGLFTETEVVVTIKVAGRNNVQITSPHIVNFVTESAAYFKNPFDAGSGNVTRDSCVTVNGECSVTWVISDTSRLHADQRIQIIAYTYGEEFFKDNNDNGKVDGEDIGLTDAFSGDLYIDLNGNGVRDGAISYIDVNNNGVADPIEANGAIDSYVDLNGNGLLDGDIYFDANLNNVYDAGEIIFDVNFDGLFIPGEPLADSNGNNVFDYVDPYIDVDNSSTYNQTGVGIEVYTNNNSIYPGSLDYDFETTGFVDSREPFLDLNHNRIFDGGVIDQIIDVNMYGIGDLGDGVYTFGDGQLNIQSAECENISFCSVNNSVIIHDSSYVFFGTE